jgi:hypothetical protein
MEFFNSSIAVRENTMTADFMGVLKRLDHELFGSGLVDSIAQPRAVRAASKARVSDSLGFSAAEMNPRSVRSGMVDPWQCATQARKTSSTLGPSTTK